MRQGLITSGLNHAVDHAVEKFKLNKYLKDKGYKPNDIPKGTLETVMKFIEDLDILKNMYEDETKNREYKISVSEEYSATSQHSEGMEASALTNIYDTTSNTTIYQSAFANYRNLFHVIGHGLAILQTSRTAEFAIVYKNQDKYNPVAYLEFFAWKWDVNYDYRPVRAAKAAAMHYKSQIEK